MTESFEMWFSAVPEECCDGDFEVMYFSGNLVFKIQLEL